MRTKHRGWKSEEGVFSPFRPFSFFSTFAPFLSLSLSPFAQRVKKGSDSLRDVAWYFFLCPVSTWVCRYESIGESAWRCVNHYVTNLRHAKRHVPSRRVHIAVRVVPTIVFTTCRKAYVEYMEIPFSALTDDSSSPSLPYMSGTYAQCTYFLTRYRIANDSRIDRRWINVVSVSRFESNVKRV